MLTTIINDYLWTIDTDNDNRELFDLCLFCEDLIKQKLPVPAMGTYGSASTAAFADYNIFTFVNPAMVKLYHSIVQSVKPFLNANEHYACQAWLNVFRAGEFIDWHKHWPAEDQCFHGYYCVNANNSTTSYRLNDQVYNVANHNGLVVFGRSAGDEHRSSPCTEPMPRVTIAFDIVPTSYLNIVQRDFKINHFIPI